MNILKSSLTPIPTLTLQFIDRVPAGFPSTLGDDQDIPLDLNRHLVRNKASTFFVRVTGDSMINAGIHDGDMLVVDRSLKPKNENVIIAALNGKMTVKRLHLNDTEIQLVPENPSFPIIDVSEEMEFSIWGVVTSVIHDL